MIGGLKQARFEFSSIRQPQLKTKHIQVQQKDSCQTIVDKQQGEDDEELLPEVAKEQVAPTSSPAAVKGKPRYHKDKTESDKTLDFPTDREPPAVATSDAGLAGRSVRGRPRTRASTGQANALALKQQSESQQGQSAGDGVLEGGPQCTSSGALQPRTGDDIWQLNIKLSKIVQQLADPGDSKPSRRKQNGPTLTENLTKRWGGNYSQLLDKSFPVEDTDEPPAPKYEPPLFLEDAKVEGVECEDDKEEWPGTREGEDPVSEASPMSRSLLKDNAKESGPVVVPLQKGGAATMIPAIKAGSGRRDAATGARRAAAVQVTSGAAASKGQVAVVAEAVGEADQTREDIGGCEDAAADAQASGDPPDMATSGRDRQTDEDMPLAPRRGGRKAKGTGKEAAMKSAQPRPKAPVRRTNRGAGAASKAAAAVDPDPGDSMDTMPPPTTVPPPVPPGSTNPSRLRKSVLSVTAFGSTLSKPPLPPPMESMDDAAPGGSEQGTIPAKRTRDTIATLDEKQRTTKACRTEQQQQAKDNELLRSRNAELELRCRQQADQIKELKEERTVAEKRIMGLEMDRKRDASDLAAAQREVEKLKVELKDRDDKVKARDVELTKLRQSMLEVKQLKEQMDAAMKGWPK